MPAFSYRHLNRQLFRLRFGLSLFCWVSFFLFFRFFFLVSAPVRYGSWRPIGVFCLPILGPRTMRSLWLYLEEERSIPSSRFDPIHSPPRPRCQKVWEAGKMCFLCRSLFPSGLCSLWGVLCQLACWQP